MSNIGSCICFKLIADYLKLTSLNNFKLYSHKINKYNKSMSCIFKYKKLFYAFVCLFFIFIFGLVFLGAGFFQPALALDEFDTSYQIDYTVNSDTSITVVQKISLTNRLANVYASEYKINLGTTRIKDIWAKDSAGSLFPDIETGPNSTSITLKFGQKVVGKGNTLSFTLGYTSNDYAIKSGRVLEIAIPKIAESQNLSNLQVILSVPAQFESPAYIFPQPQKTEKADGLTKYYFSSLEAGQQSISAAFGNFQIFNFIFYYHLINKNPTKVKFEVALPPDTLTQQVFYNSISPAPENITVDNDGNWLGTFIVDSLDKVDVTASGSAKIFLKPYNKDLMPSFVSGNYLAPQEYWETDSEEIKSLAQELNSPKNIYDFVVNSLIYDYAKVELKPQRLGALKTLDNKSSAVCMEFTDLFIALSRAADIPAREVNGYAYTNNPNLRPLSLQQDILHAWPQYYDRDSKAWVSIDPTWGNTTGGVDFFHKLDLNHFAFVFHGLDSQYPLSPGSYKDVNDNSKDIVIDFGTKVEPLDKVEVKADLPEKVLAGVPIKAKFFLKNQGNYALHQKLITISSSDLNFPAKDYKVKIVPPFAFTEISLDFPKTSVFTNGVKTVTVAYEGLTREFEVEVRSFLPPFIAKPLSFIYNLAVQFIAKYFKK
jgi:hypothetical protein